MKFKLIIFLLIAGVATTAYMATKRGSQEGVPDAVSIDQNTPPEPAEKLVQVEVVEDSTYGTLMDDAGVPGSVSAAIYNASVDAYDLASVRLGRMIDLYFDRETNELVKLIYQIDTEEELHVTRQQVEVTEVPADASSTEPIVRTETKWLAERAPIQYDVQIVTKEGTVESSMYQAAIDGDIDIRAIIELANAFQWSIDFALDPRVGDTFRFVYEERYREGEYIGPGRILAGRYVNAGTPIDVFYFEETEENTGYFDSDGNSTQKIFLKAPVAFKYISSGFTTGARYVAAFNVSTGHRAIDYAASLGTPVRAVGDGVVTHAGWNTQGYGNLISIRHNGTYSTNYAHLSKIYVRSGERVTQGETIGAVGSTGFSTGPHLHYEMVKNGVKINPLNEVLPPGEPIAEENRDRFFEAIKPLQEELGG